MTIIILTRSNEKKGTVGIFFHITRHVRMYLQPLTEKLFGGLGKLRVNEFNMPFDDYYVRAPQQSEHKTSERGGEKNANKQTKITKSRRNEIRQCFESPPVRVVKFPGQQVP